MSASGVIEYDELWLLPFTGQSFDFGEVVDNGGEIEVPFRTKAGWNVGMT
jgi:hypothetical protein